MSQRWLDIRTFKAKARVVFFFLKMSYMRKKKHKDKPLLLWHIAQRITEQPHAPQMKRVRRIVELLLVIRDTRGTLAALDPLDKLGAAIKRYRFRYHLALGDHLHARLGASSGNLSDLDLWEYGAVKTLLELAEVPNGLDRIHKCEIEACNAIYFTKKRDVELRFCSARCRQRYYDSAPDNREKKRRYMRTYYAGLKTHSANPKSGIGLQKRRKHGVK